MGNLNNYDIIFMTKAMKYTRHLVVEENIYYVCNFYINGEPFFHKSIRNMEMKKWRNGLIVIEDNATSN